MADDVAAFGIDGVAVTGTMAERKNWTVLTFPTNTLIASQTCVPAAAS